MQLMASRAAQKRHAKGFSLAGYRTIGLEDPENLVTYHRESALMKPIIHLSVS